LRAEGCGIYPVYGIEDAIRIANKNSNKEVVFMAIGFETTAPTTASILLKDPPSNFSVLSCHRLIPPVLKAILEMGELRIDGLIEPGHVSVIIGLNPYRFISKDYKIPQVVAGFEPMDLLIGVWMLAEQIEKGEAKVENEYTRAVKEEGNLKAREAIQKVFELKDTEWRGFPVIPKSGLKLKQKFEKYDAEKKFEEELIELKSKEFSEPRGCRCGELLRGLITPAKCPLFGRKCTPSHPVGPCMVSREGSCSIEFKYSKSK
jgi:hydrogenase expression/formation protein HypD